MSKKQNKLSEKLLEFIELNCCDLNFYTRRKIKERADTEILISLDDFTNVNNEINLKNQEKENYLIFHIFTLKLRYFF